jgi:hypothetical protein
MEQIYSPSEVWDKTFSPTIIAKDVHTGITIYAVPEDCAFKSLTIYILCDGNVICEEEVLSADECEARLTEIYELYLASGGYDDTSPEQERIDEREEELDQATIDFLSVAIGEDFNNYDADTFGEIIEDCKEHFLEYLARKHSINVYRPMFLEDTETGEDYFTETPYEDMVFEDEDNPIYK